MVINNTQQAFIASLLTRIKQEPLKTDVDAPVKLNIDYESIVEGFDYDLCEFKVWGCLVLHSLTSPSDVDLPIHFQKESLEIEINVEDAQLIKKHEYKPKLWPGSNLLSMGEALTGEMEAVEVNAGIRFY